MNLKEKLSPTFGSKGSVFPPVDRLATVDALNRSGPPSCYVYHRWSEGKVIEQRCQGEKSFSSNL